MIAELHKDDEEDAAAALLAETVQREASEQAARDQAAHKQAAQETNVPPKSHRFDGHGSATGACDDSQTIRGSAKESHQDSQ